MAGPVAPIVLLATLLNGLLVALALQRSPLLPGGRSLAALAGSLAWSGIFRLLEVSTPAPDLALTYRVLGELGLCAMPVLYLRLAQATTGQQGRLSSRIEVAAALALAGLFAGLALGGHGFRVEPMPRLDTLDGPDPLYGNGYGCFLPLVFVASFRHLAEAARDGPDAAGARHRALALVAGAMIPVTGREMLLGLGISDLVSPADATFLMASANVGLVAAAFLLGAGTQSLASAADTVGAILGDALLVADPDRQLVYLNPEAQRLLGGNRAGTPLPAIFANPEAIDDLCTRSARGEAERTETEVVREDGTRIPVLVSITAHRGPRGDADAWMAVLKDASDARGRVMKLEEARARLERAALTDPLTGLRNRRYLSERLAEECARARRYKQVFAVALLDLDDFKPINDRFGHAAGDAVLVGVAGALRSVLRESDLVARIGGDEFVTLLIDANPQTAPIVTLRIAAALEAVRTEATPSGVRASIGVAFWRPDADPETLLAEADAAMYRCKRKAQVRS